MSDFEDGGINAKGGFDQMKSGWSQMTQGLRQMTANPFFGFSTPYLDFIGKGKLFSTIYVFMAVVSLVLPFVVIFKVIDSGIFDWGGAKFAIVFIFAWLVIAFACWIGFQIWWNRRKKAAAIIESGNGFTGTHIFSEIVQTFGEWAGTLIGIISAGAGIIAAIILGRDANDLFNAIGLDFLQFGAMVVIIGPLTGFLIILVSRVLAEQLRRWAALITNTNAIAERVGK